MSLFELLLHGKPGHPAHPPLTDLVIGMFALASGLALLGRLGVAEGKLGPAAWLALIGGLVAAAPAAVTGFADWGADRLGLCALAHGHHPPDGDGHVRLPVRRGRVAAVSGLPRRERDD